MYLIDILIFATVRDLKQERRAKQRKSSFKLCILFPLSYFEIIPTCLTCQMWPNCAGTEFVGTALKFTKKKKKITVVCSRSAKFSQNWSFYVVVLQRTGTKCT